MSKTKRVYLLRHAEKDPMGTLTENGRKQARLLSGKLPKFVIVLCSDSARTKETAVLLTGETPIVDTRCGFYTAPKEKSDMLNKIAKNKNIFFLQAVSELNDEEVNRGVDAKANELNSLIDETIRDLPGGESALIVSHDLSISPALAKRGIPLESIDYLCGYVINENGDVEIFLTNLSV